MPNDLTMHVSEVPWQTQDLKQLADLLLDAGFRIIIAQPSSSYPRTTWMHFEEKGNIGYAQGHCFGYSASTGSGLDYSTVHKPCKEFGTGFRLNNEGEKPSLDMARATFARRPHWSTWNPKHCPTCTCHTLDPIKKYVGLDDFLNYENRFHTSLEVIKDATL